MRSMVFASLLISSAYFGQESAPQRTVRFPNGEIEARGACDIRPESIACWDLAGSKATAIEDTVRAALANGQEVSFRVGKKNRILVVRRPNSVSVNYRTGANNGMYGTWQLGGDSTTEFIRYPAELSETQVVLTAQTTVQSSKDEEMLFREGVSTDVDGRKVEVGAVQKVEGRKTPPNPRFFNGYNRPVVGNAWNIVLGLSGKEGEYVNWAFTVLDSNGLPIRYVDAQGKPISAVRALALEPTLGPNNFNGYTNNDPGAPKPKAAVAYFQGAGLAPAFRAMTNIDPKAISKLRIRASHQETADLGPFPLDPK